MYRTSLGPLPRPRPGRRRGRRVTTSRGYTLPYYPGPVLNVTVHPGESPQYVWWGWAPREYQVTLADGVLYVTHEWSRK